MADGRKSPQPAMPLPPGWEAKYDFAQKRYFYVNHNNKTTTWEDPRLKLLEKQQGLHANEGQTSSRVSPRSTPVKTTAGGGWQTQIESKYGMKVELIKDDPTPDPEMVKRIMARFPTAGKELVNMVANDVSSEEEVCAKLRVMGYREQRSASNSPTHGATSVPASASSLSITKSGGARPLSPAQKLDLNLKPSSSDAKRASPDKTVNVKNVLLTNTNDKRSSSPGRPTKGKGSGHKSHSSGSRTETGTDKKKKLREKLEQEFKTLEKPVIESVLSSCSYDEDKARSELQQLNAVNSLKSVVITTTNATGHVSAHNNGNKVASEMSLPDVPTYDSFHSTAASETNDHLGYKSSLRQEPRGPDSSLARGPNKQLLLSDYVSDTGSQSSNYHGPCKENYHGPCSELRKGHEAGMAKGPAASG